MGTVSVESGAAASTTQQSAPGLETMNEMKTRSELQTESFSALVKMHHIGIKTNFSRNFLVSSMHFPHAKL